MSNLSDEMSMFVTGVSNLHKKECRTMIICDDMNLFRLVLYAQSIEESKLRV